MPISRILPLLPYALSEEIRRRLSSSELFRTSPAEVRMRQGRIASLSVYRSGALVNIPLSFIGTKEDMYRTLSHATGGSAYAYEEELKMGFFTISGGIRIGVSGCVRTAGGESSLTDIESLVFRLPAAKGCADTLYTFYEQTEGGILIFAPPGAGKTTLLRAFAEKAARTRRVAVIDSRREFFFSDPDILIDHLSGYPKAEGAELALRTLSPELIILDEVGMDESAALCRLVSFGVRAVASLHGDSADRLMSIPAIRPLLTSGLFSHLWDVRRGAAAPICIARTS